MTAIAGDDRAETAAPRIKLGPCAAYAAFALTATLSFLPTVATMAATWTSSGSYHHGFLIAPLVLWLIWRERSHDGSSPLPRPASVRPSGAFTLRGEAGLAAVAACAALWLIGRTASANIVEQFAFVSLLIAGTVVGFGADWARARAFPLALLYFMVPAGTSLAPALQTLAATTVTALLGSAGIETARDGLLLTTSTGRFEIAEGCAGLNFLLASLLIAAVYGWLAMSAWPKRLLLIAAAAALALAANILRIFLVIALTAWSGGRIEIAADHLVFGWILYGALLMAFLFAARRFADTREPRGVLATANAPAFVPILVAVALVAGAALSERAIVAAAGEPVSRLLAAMGLAG